MNDANTTAPGWFKGISIVAMIWNLIGIVMFGLFMMMLSSPEMLDALPEDQKAAMLDMPGWAKIAYAAAVFGGFLGCLMLVLKKNMAGIFLMLSLVGILVQDYHSLVVAGSYETYGPTGLIMPAIVLVIAVYLIMLARKAKANGWTS